MTPTEQGMGLTVVDVQPIFACFADHRVYYGHISMRNVTSVALYEHFSDDSFKFTFTIDRYLLNTHPWAQSFHSEPQI